MIFISSKASDGNMDFRCGDNKVAKENRTKFLKKLGIKNIVEVKQVHDNNIVFVQKVIGPNTVADGMITNSVDLYLMLRVADCIPIGFYNPKHNVICLIHTGWRGLEKGIIRKAVNELVKNFRSDPKDLIVKFGPSIGPCHYRMDLWKEAENQLMELGILKKNIDNPRICTYESKDYFSHRRAEDTNTPDYRFVTILGLKDINGY